jgi:hypothetical protein
MKITLGWLGRFRGRASGVLAPAESAGTTEPSAGIAQDAESDFKKSLLGKVMIFKLLLTQLRVIDLQLRDRST